MTSHGLMLAKRTPGLGNASIPVGRFMLTPFRQLTEGGRPVAIGLKSLQLLSVLAQARGALVTKEELMDAVWPNLIVEENALQTHIVSLRRVLGPDRSLLCTCHGLGYLLTPTSSPQYWRPARVEAPRSLSPPALTAGAVMLVTLGGAWLVLTRVAR